mgnify:CR=1 FL=1
MTRCIPAGAAYIEAKRSGWAKSGILPGVLGLAGRGRGESCGFARAYGFGLALGLGFGLGDGFGAGFGLGRASSGRCRLRTLVAIPVYNESKHLRAVLDRVLEHAGNVLVVDDGSTDDSPALLGTMPVDVIRHCVNRGYGRSLIDAFRFAASEKYDWVITMDSDEQHEPERLPEFFEAIEKNDADIISGSRYLRAPTQEALALAPGDRRRINGLITEEINALLAHRLGTKLTDSFCGFKAHRVSATNRLELSEDGYAFPMQLWARAAAHGLRVREIPVDLIYNDQNRTFGAALNDPEARLKHYREVLHREITLSGGRVGGSQSGHASLACREAGLSEPVGRRAVRKSNHADCPDLN